jgi:carboxymethylenebutenolidase
MMYRTDMYEGMLAETIALQGAQGDMINAYFARPLGPGPFPGVVLIHHMPGWDAWYREATRKFAAHGYLALSPNLYCREGHGAPEDVAARVRGAGGVPDDQVVGDVAGALAILRAVPYCSGKIGVFGTCSGGRHAVLAASRIAGGFDAAVDCWGGRVVMTADDLTPRQPVAPLDYTADLACPLLGLFGADDQSPTPEQEALHESCALRAKFVTTGAGHALFYYDHRTNARSGRGRLAEAFGASESTWEGPDVHDDQPAGGDCGQRQRAGRLVHGAPGECVL